MSDSAAAAAAAGCNSKAEGRVPRAFEMQTAAELNLHEQIMGHSQPPLINSITGAPAEVKPVNIHLSAEDTQLGLATKQNTPEQIQKTQLSV